MPVNLDPMGTGKMPDSKFSEGLYEADYEYRYPRGLDLKPGSDFHEELRKKIWDRAWDSRRLMSTRYDDWREIDKTLRAYVPVEPKALGPSKVKGRAEDVDEDEDDPLQRIVMPVTFANMETMLTYMMTAFLQDPIFKYDGMGPEDQYGAYLMTQVVAQQCHKARIGLNLHTQWRDAFAYGIGVTHPEWYRRFGKKVVAQDEGFFSQVRNMFRVTGKRKETVEGVLWQGNRLNNIDPYRFFPDPQVSAHEVQEGEFVGWLDETNFMRLLSREKDKEDFVFNVKYLRHISHGRSTFSGLMMDHREDEQKVNRRLTGSNNPVDVLYMYVNLIPSEWGVGRGKYPEKWLFMLGGDQVILAAQPLGLNHDMFPVSIAAPDYDGYSAAPPSRLRITLDIQHIIDFLYSSHIANVRKAINDVIIFDPSMINQYDLNRPKPGMRVRTRRSTWGRGGIDAAIKQLDVRDVTMNHVNDAGVLMEFMRQVQGTSENLQGGIVRRGERVSATESRDARSSGLARLERLARLISMQSMLDTAYMFASHTQQFLDEETYVKVVGELPERLRAEFGADVDNGRVLVDPLDLLVDLDLIELDGTIPGSESAEAWIEILQIAGQSPEVLGSLEMPKLITHIARHLGAKNPEDFIKKAAAAPPRVMEDEDVMRQVEAGNLVPMPSGDGAPPMV